MREACGKRGKASLARERMGLPPTGGSVAFTEMVFYTFTDGRMSEIWSLFDEAGMKAQLMA